MAKTRRDLIMNLVREYTSESLADKSFSFERCNAFDIALDLKLDRSNVSKEDPLSIYPRMLLSANIISIIFPKSSPEKKT